MCSDGILESLAADGAWAFRADCLNREVREGREEEARILESFVVLCVLGELCGQKRLGGATLPLFNVQPTELTTSADQ